MKYDEKINKNIKIMRLIFINNQVQCLIEKQ